MAERDLTLKLPKHIYLETTNQCNLKCKGCIQYRGSWEPERSMSLEEFIMITEQLPGLERAVLHGIGEPLLNRELPDMIRHLKNKQVHVLFNSNGILITEEWQQELIDSGLDEMRISLDAASPDVYKAIRSSDNFNLIVNNLNVFSDLIKSRQLSKPRLSLWFLGDRENIIELPKFVRFAASIGIMEVHLQRLVYFQDHEGYGLAKAEKTLMNSYMETTKLIRESQGLARQLGVWFSASGLIEPVKSIQGAPDIQSPWRRCNRPFSVMYITVNGNTLPCCISPFSTFDYRSIILGNVFESPLSEIWFGHAYEEFRKNLQTDLPPKCCQGCGVLWSL